MKFFKIVLLSLVLLALSFSFSHIPTTYPNQGTSHDCMPASTGAGQVSPMCSPPPNGDHVHTAYQPTIQPPIRQPKSNFQ